MLVNMAFHLKKKHGHNMLAGSKWSTSKQVFYLMASGEVQFFVNTFFSDYVITYPAYTYFMCMSKRIYIFCVCYMHVNICIGVVVCLHEHVHIRYQLMHFVNFS